MQTLAQTQAFAKALARTRKPDPTIESMRRERARIDRVIAWIERRSTMALPAERKSQPTVLPSHVQGVAKILHAVFGA